MGLFKLKSISFTMAERCLIDVDHTPGINYSGISHFQYQIMIIFLLFVRMDKNSGVVIVPVDVSSVAVWIHNFQGVHLQKEKSCGEGVRGLAIHCSGLTACQVHFVQLTN